MWHVTHAGSHMLKVFGFYWYWCYYPHTSRNLVSPICGISPNRPTGSIWSSRRNVRLYVCIILSPPHVIFFKASHWPSDHMISSGPLIGQSSFPPPLKKKCHQPLWQRRQRKKLYWCYYLHLLRDLVSPLWGIFRLGLSWWSNTFDTLRS